MEIGASELFVIVAILVCVAMIAIRLRKKRRP